MVLIPAKSRAPALPILWTSMGFGAAPCRDEDQAHQPSWEHTKHVQAAWECSAEPIPARGGRFVLVQQPVALPALQWCSFSACRTPEKNPGATDQEPSTLVQDQCTWSWALSSEQRLEQTYSLHEMCIVWLAYNKADDQSWMIISLVSQVLRSYQDLYNAVSMTVPWFIFSKVRKRKWVQFSLYSVLWNGTVFIALSYLHRQQGIQIHRRKHHTGFQRLSRKPSWHSQQVFSKSL